MKKKQKCASVLVQFIKHREEEEEECWEIPGKRKSGVKIVD